MISPEGVRVIGRNGLRGRAEPGAWVTQKRGTVLVTLDDGARVEVPAEVMQQRDEQTYEVPIGPEDLEAIEGGVVPVAEERVHVSKERVPHSRVVVHKTVHQDEKTVEQLLEHEDVEVRHVPIGEYVDQPAGIRQEGETTIVPVYEEVAVLQKRLLLREEVHIIRSRRQEPWAEQVTVRREDTRIDRVPTEGSAEARDPASRANVEKGEQDSGA